MRRNQRFVGKRVLAASLLILLLAAGGASSFVFASCGPFTDVGTLICPFVLELYYMGITAGTSATTFSPNDPVTRGQMAVFTATSLNQSLKRGSRRAALNQWWTTTPHWDLGLGVTTIPGGPVAVVSDGADIWTANSGAPSSSVCRIRASDGALLGTWTGIPNAYDLVAAMGRIFVASASISSSLYMIDPTSSPGPATLVASGLGNNVLGFPPRGIAFDGSRIWTSNLDGSVSIVTPQATLPWPATNVQVVSSATYLFGMLFDGSNIWVIEVIPGFLLKLDNSGSILQSVGVGDGVNGLVFDGSNIWVSLPMTQELSVVRASTGAVVASVAGYGINNATRGAFDGKRILFVNSGDQNVTLWDAATVSPLGFFPTTDPSATKAVCSDGVSFWLALPAAGAVARF